MELLLVLLLVVFLFGATKLPALGAGMGKAVRSFKDAVNPEATKAEGKSGTPGEPPKA